MNSDSFDIRDRNCAIYWSLLILAGLAFYYLNLKTPLMGDDLEYSFYFGENSAIERPTSIPISSFWQIIPSMWNHYCAVNGRFTSHFLIQVFCGLTGKGFFNLCNAIVFILFIDLIVRLSTGTRNVTLLSFSILGSLLLLPFPGQTMLWLTGSVNYLWTTTFSLMILQWVLTQNHKHISAVLGAVLFFAGLFVGWMNESVTIGLSIGFLLCLLIDKKRISRSSYPLILGYIVGSALIVFSPGTFTRLSSGEINLNMSVFQMFTSRVVILLQMLLKIPILFFLFCGTVLFFVPGFRNKYDSTFRLLLFTGIGIGVFLFLLGKDEVRVYFALSCLALIMLSHLLVVYCVEKSNIPFKFTGVFVTLILVVFLFLKAEKEVDDYSSYNDALKSEIIKSPEVCVLEYHPFDSSKYVYANLVCPDKNDLRNKVLSYFYNKKSIQAISPPIYIWWNSGMPLGELSEESFFVGNDDKINAYSLDRYYVFPEVSVSTPVQVEYIHASGRGGLNYRQKVIRYLLGSLDQKSFYVGGFTLSDEDGHSYLLFPKDPLAEVVYLKTVDGELNIKLALNNL